MRTGTAAVTRAGSTTSTPRDLPGAGPTGEIPLPARIVALADVFDALISKRTYKPEWKQEHALRYIRYQAGKKFDPELVGLFINMAELSRPSARSILTDLPH